MLYGIFLFSIIFSIATISRIKENTHIDFSIKKYFKDYIGIFFLYYIVLFILMNININKFIGGMLYIAFAALVSMISPVLLEKREKDEIEKLEKREKDEIEKIEQEQIKAQELENQIRKDKEEREKLEREQKELEEKERAEKERLEQEIEEDRKRKAWEKEEEISRIKDYGIYREFVSNLQNTVNIFDTNIFMDSEYNDIFEFFRKNDIKILMTEKQFDEIVNLKHKDNIDKNIKARYALNLINFLSKEDILNIGFTSLSLNIDFKAYADPEIFEYCLKISETHKVNFVTNDRVLSIKTIQLSKKNNKKNSLQVFDGDEFSSFINQSIPFRYR